MDVEVPAYTHKPPISASPFAFRELLVTSVPCLHVSKVKVKWDYLGCAGNARNKGKMEIYLEADEIAMVSLHRASGESTASSSDGVGGSSP